MLLLVEEKDKNENDGLGTATAAGPNDKSSSSANESEKKILNPQWKNSNGETINTYKAPSCQY